MADGAEPAVVYPCLQLDHRRMKPSRIGDSQHHPGARHRLYRRLGALQIEGERLFHEDMLAGRRGALDLAAVLAVRRRKDDSIDCWVGEDLVEIVFEGDPVLGAERLGRSTGAGMGRREADHAALALHRIDERSAPPAEPDNGGVDHLLAASMSRTPRNAR